MLNFNNNAFFTKFCCFFIFILIFNFWAIDLNSEEVFIAFSCVFLVVVGFLFSRAAVLSMFLGSFNSLYNNFLNMYLTALFNIEVFCFLVDSLLASLWLFKSLSLVVFRWRFLRHAIMRRLGASVRANSLRFKIYYVVNTLVYVNRELCLKKNSNIANECNRVFTTTLL